MKTKQEWVQEWRHHATQIYRDPDDWVGELIAEIQADALDTWRTETKLPVDEAQRLWRIERLVDATFHRLDPPLSPEVAKMLKAASDSVKPPESKPQWKRIEDLERKAALFDYLASFDGVQLRLLCYRAEGGGESFTEAVEAAMQADIAAGHYKPNTYP